MRIRLTDGSSLDLKGDTPSKRSTKQKGGSLKRWNSQRVLAACGGYSSEVVAIGQPIGAPLCVVRVEGANQIDPITHRVTGRSSREYTMDLGGSTYTGYLGGRGL